MSVSPMSPPPWKLQIHPGHALTWPPHWTMCSAASSLLGSVLAHALPLPSSFLSCPSAFNLPFCLCHFLSSCVGVSSQAYVLRREVEKWSLKSDAQPTCRVLFPGAAGAEMPAQLSSNHRTWKGTRGRAPAPFHSFIPIRARQHSQGWLKVKRTKPF